MEHLVIDQKKCIRCNRCVQDCPMGIPDVEDNGKIFSNEKNAEVCIYCGHCVAVCPERAIELYPIEEKENLAEMADYGIVPFELRPEECNPTELKDIPRPEQLEALIRSRRMTRSFREDLVPHGVVEHIVKDVLAYTPTGHNNRGYQVKIVEGRENLEKLTELSIACFDRMVQEGTLHSFDKKVFMRMSEVWKEKKIDRVFRSAKQAMVVHCKSSIVPADPAVKVMLTYFEMLCNSMGIGTVWAGYFMVAGNEPKIKEFLNIPEEDTIYGAMMFGYPEFTYDWIPKRPMLEVEYI